MEAFINRSFWLMSLNEIRKLKESIAKQTALTASTRGTTNGTTANQTINSAATTSPNEAPPPSPASSVGSSAGSLAPQPSSSSGDQQSQSQQSLSQIELMQKTLTMHERYQRLMDYTLRSQTFWDSNESMIGDSDLLNGQFLTFHPNCAFLVSLNRFIPGFF